MAPLSGLSTLHKLTVVPTNTPSLQLNSNWEYGQEVILGMHGVSRDMTTELQRIH